MTSAHQPPQSPPGPEPEPPMESEPPTGSPPESPPESVASDRIAIFGLRAQGRHGVFDHERVNGQEFVVDILLNVDTRLAAATDDLVDTVDYGALATDVVAIIEGDPVDLIETLADRIARRGLADSRVRAVEVTVHKPQAPVPVPFTDVTVTISRRQSDRSRP